MGGESKSSPMAISIRESSKMTKNRAKVNVSTLTETNIRELGETTQSMEMGSSNFQTEIPIILIVETSG
jgi:hypothetical protein